MRKAICAVLNRQPPLSWIITVINALDSRWTKRRPRRPPEQQRRAAANRRLGYRRDACARIAQPDLQTRPALAIPQRRWRRLADHAIGSQTRRGRGTDGAVRFLRPRRRTENL